MAKRMVQEIKQVFTESRLTGTLADVRQYIGELINTYGENASLEYDFIEWGDSESFMVRVARPETDAEYEKRVQKELLAMIKTEATERAKLKELVQKYGVPNDE